MSNKFQFNLMLYLVSFLSFAGGTIYLSALPEIALLFQVSSTAIKFSLTIFFIGLFFGALLFAPLGEMYGRTWPLIFFLLLFTVGSLLACFSMSISWFFFARFLQGFGLASGPIIAISLVADRYHGAEYHKYLTYVLLMIGMGGGIGPVLGSVVLHFFSWKGIFYFLAVLGLLAILLVLKMRKEMCFTPRNLAEIKQEYSYFLKHPIFRIYCLLIGVLVGTLYVFMTVIPYIFRLHYGWDIIEFSWVGISITASESMGNLLVKRLAQTWGSLKIFLLGFMIIASSLFLMILFKLPPKGIEFLSILSLLAMGVSTCATCLISAAEKVNRIFSGIASGIINLSKIAFIAISLIVSLFLPESLNIIEIFISASLVICALGYLKIRQLS